MSKTAAKYRLARVRKKRDHAYTTLNQLEKIAASWHEDRQRLLTEAATRLNDWSRQLDAVTRPPDLTPLDVTQIKIEMRRQVPTVWSIPVAQDIRQRLESESQQLRRKIFQTRVLLQKIGRASCRERVYI